MPKLGNHKRVRRLEREELKEEMLKHNSRIPEKDEPEGL